MTRTEQFVGQSFFLLRCPLEKGILERKYWQLRSCRKAIVLSSDFEIFYKDREQFFFLFFFCTIDLNFLLDKNFWALNKIFMNYRTYYYPIIQYPQRNLFYFASLSRWRASFMRNEQEKKINIVLSVIALEFITETETPSNLSTAFLDVRTKNYDFWRFLFDLFRKNLEKRII